MKCASRYVRDTTIWLVFFLVSQVYAAKWENVEEIIRGVFLFAVMLVFVSDVFVFIAMIRSGGGRLI